MSTETAPAAARLPAAVLWDLDGTIVDTEPMWVAAEYDLAARHGASWSDAQALDLIGSDLHRTGAVIREQMGLSLTVDEIVDDLIDAMVRGMAERLDWRPGARELLLALREAGVPQALVTMSYRRIVTPLLAVLPDGLFDAVVVGDEVEHGKPHPEPYLAAARRLGVPAERCVAIEDSPTGGTSALAAGCRTMIVPAHAPIVPRPGWYVVDTLAGVAPQHLTSLPTP